jgi:hypothetical protein
MEDNLFDKYERFLNNKAKEALYRVLPRNSRSIELNRKSRKVDIFNISVKPRNKFYISDVVKLIVDDLNYIANLDAIAGSEEKPLIKLKMNHNDILVKMSFYVFSEKEIEVRLRMSENFTIFDTDSPRIYPFNYSEPKCTCGVSATYQDKARRQMHSDFCEMSEVPDK